MADELNCKARVNIEVVQIFIHDHQAPRRYEVSNQAESSIRHAGLQHDNGEFDPLSPQPVAAVSEIFQESPVHLVMDPPPRCRCKFGNHRQRQFGPHRERLVYRCVDQSRSTGRKHHFHTLAGLRWGRGPQGSGQQAFLQSAKDVARDRSRGVRMDVEIVEVLIHEYHASRPYQKSHQAKSAMWHLRL